MRVGVFDSGIGGLSVVKSLLDSHAFEEIIYFGDTARVPYGVKDSETIIRYSLEALAFLREFDIDMLIVACNTASAHALEALRQAADVDVIGVIEPGVLALENRLPDKNSPILVIGTKATTASGQYPALLKEHGYTHIQSLATGLLVPLVEEGIFHGSLLESALEHYFSSLAVKPKAIILAAPTFPSSPKPSRPILITNRFLFTQAKPSCSTSKSAMNWTIFPKLTSNILRAKTLSP